jgi:hypothetical protein
VSFPWRLKPTQRKIDRDLASLAEARALARRAKQAWVELAEFSQERIDDLRGMFRSS